MGDHPDVAVLRAAMDSFTAGDVTGLGATLSPDVVWRIPGTNRVSGEFRGIDATLGGFARVVELDGWLAFAANGVSDGSLRVYDVRALTGARR